MAGAPITGTVALLGDHVSADVILPARHSFLAPSQMAEHVLAELGDAVNRAVNTHPVIVAGEAFGYGTGRESPVRALRAAGVRAVVAVSFSRMFFRNAINNGILVLQCAALVKGGIAAGDDIHIDASAGIVRWQDRDYRVDATPDVVARILAAGSLVEYGRQRLLQREAA